MLANGDLSSAITMYRRGLAAAAELGYKDGMANALRESPQFWRRMSWAKRSASLALARRCE
jgi:hypothetical protein